jgi:hypothetical protein
LQGFNVLAYAISFGSQDQGTHSFAKSQILARAVALLMPAFRARASGKDSHVVMTSAIERVLKLITAFLRSAGPRCLVAAESRQPLLIFTDASL